jgi:hypothetical protein
VFAPSSPWRADVVAYGRGATSSKPDAATKPRVEKKSKQKHKGAETVGREPAPRAPRTALDAGIVPPVGARIDWASLLRRIYLEDVLACPCGGPRRLVATIDEPAAIKAILDRAPAAPRSTRTELAARGGAPARRHRTPMGKMRPRGRALPAAVPKGTRRRPAHPGAGTASPRVAQHDEPCTS